MNDSGNARNVWTSGDGPWVDLSRQPGRADPPAEAAVADESGIERVVGAPVVAVQRGTAAIAVGDDGVQPVDVVVLPDSPVTDGIVRVSDGRAPLGPTEVLVSPALARAGALGIDDVVAVAGERLVVTGVGQAFRQPGADIGPRQVVLRPGAVAPGEIRAATAWLVDRPEAVDFDTADAWTTSGLTVVLPAAGRESRLPTHPLTGPAYLFVVMQIAALAAPAFIFGTLGTRRRLELMVVVGADPRALRRAALVAAVLLGGIGSVAGAGGGVLLGLAATGPLWPDSRFGVAPALQIEWQQIGGVVLAGLLASLLAAAWPVYRAGRTGQRPSTWAGQAAGSSPGRPLARVGAGLLGVALLAGLALVVFRQAGLFVLIPGAGVLLVAAAAVAGIGRLARALPLPIAIAARVVARSPARSTAAVTAICLTTVGLLSVAAVAQGLADRDTSRYTADAPVGATVITTGDPRSELKPLVPSIEQAIARLRPESKVVATGSVLASEAAPSPLPAQFALDGAAPAQAEPESRDGGAPPVDPLAVGGARVLPADALEWLGYDVGATDRSLLRSGGALVAGQGLDAVLPAGDEVTLPLWQNTTDTGWAPAAREIDLRRIPTHPERAGEVIVAPETADAFGTWTVDQIIVSGAPLTRAEIADVTASVDAALDVRVASEDRNATNRERVAVAVLRPLAVLALGTATLVATALSLFGSRPDRHILTMVGAHPRTRILIAAAIASWYSVAGIVLGAVLGLPSGWAMSSLLVAERTHGAALAGEYGRVPWQEASVLAVVLPLLIALVALVLTAVEARYPQRRRP